MSAQVPARDPGLQQERTALSWRRTGLALVAGALAIGRLTMDTLGSAVMIPAVVVAGLAAWLVLVTLRGNRYAAAHPTEPHFDKILVDGRLPALVATLVAALAVGEIAAAVLKLATRGG